MRFIIPALCLLVTGCASTAEDPAPTRPPTDAPPETWVFTERFMEGTVTNIQPDVDLVTNVISGPVDPAWQALVQVWQEIGIEIAGMDPTTRVVNNPEFTVRRRLGGERASKYLECGSGVLGGFADRFPVKMNILSAVKPGPEGQSVLETTIQAFGNNPEGTSNTRIPCISTHQLEFRIAAEVNEIVGG